MLRAVLFTLVAIVSTLATRQVPLTAWQADQHLVSILSDGDITDWSLDKEPSLNSTDHLVFETVHSLLQHWPNTRMRNGHNIVPGSIPTGTLLYHGTNRHELPPGPEWVATDPEHSYLFCRYRPGHLQQPEGCWHLTLATTRPLRVIYFDGSSAAKLSDGCLDTQDLMAWGRYRDDRTFDEKQRIQDLCAWGRDFDVDGFVRMEMDFEVMLCDFTSGVRVVSFTNLISRWAGRPTPSKYISFEVMNSGSWHNHFPGETRIQLDLSGLVSFYDTQLVPSLVAIRAGQERWDHRVRNISNEDWMTVKSRLEATLTTTKVSLSGVDWGTLIQVIVDRYAQRLELIRYLSNSSATDADETFDLANKTQLQLRVMLTPYLVFSATPPNQPDEAGLDWTTPIYKLCATTHTYSMESELDYMTDAEKLLLQAVRGTTREICRVVTRMWAAGVNAGVDPWLNTKKHDIAEINQLRTTWAEELNQLMAWLDWSVWIKCNPSCSPEEMCYLPTWPAGFPWMGGGPGRAPPPPPDHDGPPTEMQNNFDHRMMAMANFAEEIRNIINPDPEEWVRPQPKCVRRFEPYNL